MRALSIKQPWASLIASGRKTIELRTWQTDYRGDIIVCASAIPRRRTGFELGPLGVALCIVMLESIEPATSADATDACCAISAGEFAWRLVNPRPIELFAVKGRLNLWTPTPELLAHVEKVLKGRAA